MRLLIYLLALIGGFSAAEASCQTAEKSQSAVALATVALAQSASEQSVQSQRPLLKQNSLFRHDAAIGPVSVTTVAVPFPSPVVRMDLQRE